MSDQKVATNRQARFQYHIFDKFEAGVVLQGSEVKSIREGQVNLQDSFVRFEGDEAFVHNMHVKPYAYSRDYPEPTRARKLLLKRAELDKLAGRVSKKSFTCIPLSVYFNKRGKVKLEIALCQGKKLHDKREALKRREDQREMNRALKRRRKQ